MADGRHSRGAHLKLASEYDSCLAFQWPVILSSGKKSLNVLKQMAGCQTAGHSERYFVR